jgi:CxxC-x17-CxxC domain-containing protein
MGNFNRDSRDSRRPSSGFSRGFDRNKSFGGNRRPGGRDGARPEMHQAVCSECGQDCEIPFKPSNGRPIFCSKCFEKQNGGASNSRPSSFGGERRDRFGFDDKQMHSATCDKCGKECQVPFRPTAGKPVFCDNCFGKGGNDNFSKGGHESKDSGEVMQQIKMLNTKMDQLIKILAPNAPVDKVAKLAKPETVEKVAKSAKLETKVEAKVEAKVPTKEKAKTKVVAKKAPAKKKK